MSSPSLPQFLWCCSWEKGAVVEKNQELGTWGVGEGKLVSQSVSSKAKQSKRKTQQHGFCNSLEIWTNRSSTPVTCKHSVLHRFTSFFVFLSVLLWWVSPSSRSFPAANYVWTFFFSGTTAVVVFRSVVVGWQQKERLDQMITFLTTACI
jgi:hypothetical protein